MVVSKVNVFIQRDITWTDLTDGEKNGRRYLHSNKEIIFRKHHGTILNGQGK